MSNDSAYGGIGLLDADVKGIQLLLSEIIADVAENGNSCANILTIMCADTIKHTFMVDADFSFEFTDHNEWLLIRAWNSGNDEDDGGYYERALINTSSIIQITSEN